MRDIYFAKEYGQLYERIEDGESILYEYVGKAGKINHLFILRKIPSSTNSEPWYDIVTPYGYGGPIIEEIFDNHTKDELLREFEDEFGKYCSEHRIVSEFVRFHPIIDNASDFTSIYNSKCIRKTLGTNLTLDDPVAEEFSKGCRKNIRRAMSKGVSWRVTAQPSDISVFKTIYYSTMDRNGAKDYYYFDDRYFDDCQRFFRENLLFVEAIFEGKTIAAGLYFVFKDTIHIHLSGTLSEYLHLSPAYILRYATTLWGKENGYRLIHHGGGRSNADNDNLFLFKKQFASNTEFDFYVGQRIWNTDAYRALCLERGITEDVQFFPAYRADIGN